MQFLKKRYKEVAVDHLKEKFKYVNPMLVPSLKKIIISMGIAEASKDKNLSQAITNELALISGQKPIVRKSKKAISNFKLRKGQPIGLMVTLRNARMWDFLARLIVVAVPQMRDFRGFKTKCDGKGNYSLGLSEQQIFPEINIDHIKRVQGMNITFVTTAQTDAECVELLRLLGMPFAGMPVEVIN